MEPAQRCCWTSFRSPRWAGGAQRGTQTERRVVENAESWSWPEQRPPFQAWSQCSAHLQLRQQAGRARQGSLGTRTFHPEAWEGRADTPDSADSPFGALTLNAEVFSLSQESRGENRSPKREKKTFSSRSFSFTTGSPYITLTMCQASAHIKWRSPYQSCAVDTIILISWMKKSRHREVH